MKGFVRRVAGAVVSSSYHYVQTQTARGVLRVVEQDAGRLSPTLARRCDEYAHEVLGWRGYAPWLYVYTVVAGEFREGWIPDGYYGHVVVPRVKGLYGPVSNRKALTSLLFASEAFPDVAYRINGVNYTPLSEQIGDAELVAILDAQGDKVVFKVEGSSQGRSVRILQGRDLAADAIAQLGNGVFQYYVEQHPVFAAFMPSSVATVRLTTVIGSDGSPRLRASYVRFARRVDTHVRSASHVRVAIDRATGSLADIGFLASWARTDRHPDSGERFDGATIPNFEACVATVEALHHRVPFARAIGWDVVVDSKGAVQVLEWNGDHNDIKFTEATQGPCFGDLGWEHLWRRPVAKSNEWVAALRHNLC